MSRERSKYRPWPESALFLGLLVSPAPGGSDWPQFRGPNATGVVPAADIPLEWSEDENVAWKVAVPGQGWSQPVVIGGTVYLTVALGEGLGAPIRFAAGIDDPRSSKPDTAPEVTIEWRVLAFDLSTGKELWSASVCKAKPKYSIHPSNTWASETPAADANGVYAFFGATGTLAAFDTAGKPMWKAELGVHPMMFGYGTASSPALLDGKLFVQSFSEEEGCVHCFDTKSGKELWRVTREAGSSWASPLPWRNRKRTELVVSGFKLITSHDPANGKELWRLSGVFGPMMSSFAADPEHLYVGQAAAFAGGRNMMNPPLYALAPGSEGDLTPAKGDSEVKGQLWVQKMASPAMSSPVVADGLLYIAMENLLTCRDAESGEQLYKERVPELVTIAASPIIVGDKLILVDEEGHAAVVLVGPDFEVVGKGTLEDVFWSTPAVAGNALLLRGVESLYCLRK